jgi:hypothetical protein
MIFFPEEQMALQPVAARESGYGPAVIRLDWSAGDERVASQAARISRQVLKFPGLIAGYEQTVKIIPLNEQASRTGEPAVFFDRRTVHQLYRL